MKKTVLAAAVVMLPSMSACCDSLSKSEDASSDVSTSAEKAEPTKLTGKMTDSETNCLHFIFLV